MRTIAWLCLLTVALTMIWPSAVGALTGVVDMGLAARSLVAGFLLGLLFAWVMAYSAIYNRLVEADRRRAHDRVDADHDKRRV